jgi:hypothetical protein
MKSSSKARGLSLTLVFPADIFKNPVYGEEHCQDFMSWLLDWLVRLLALEKVVFKLRPTNSLNPRIFLRKCFKTSSKTASCRA